MSATSLACGVGAHAASASCYTHRAAAGDTLIGLGQRYLAPPADWRALARVNHVTNPRRIPIGTALCMPVTLMKAKPASGTVLEVVGEALRISPPGAGLPGQENPVRQGDAIPPGTSLRTGSKGYVTVQLADGSILKIQADTQARLDSSQHYEAAGFFASVWTVLRGRVESLVTHMTGGEPRYQIKTPQAVLGVRGTEFRVATDAQRTVGETLTGTVAVQGGRVETLVNAGQGTVSEQGRDVAKPTSLPAAPDVSALPALFERVLLKLALPPVAGASSYRVQVAEDADFRRVRGEDTSPVPLLRLVDLPDGDYVLRARVADARGLESVDAVRAFKLKARPEAPIPIGPAAKAKVRAKSVLLSWAAHPQAEHYRLQVARDAAFADMAHERLMLTDTQAQVDLTPGDYHWRVATTGPGNDPGPWGDAQLVLMRAPPVQLPPPSITEDSLSFQLQAEPGQRFEFQMARDAAFTHMISEVKSDEPTVAITQPDDGGTLYVRYRAIDADGFIGPYTSPQTVALPACVRSADGRCVSAGSRYMTTQP